MPQFNKHSQRNLLTCHHDLQLIFSAVEREIDCDIRCGYRSEPEQEWAFDRGESQVHWPRSPHNEKPSMAVDVVPQEMDAADLRHWYWFGGYVKGLADRLYAEGIVTHRVRWAGDSSDQPISEYSHFEIYLPEKH